MFGSPQPVPVAEPIAETVATSIATSIAEPVAELIAEPIEESTMNPNSLTSLRPRAPIFTVSLLLVTALLLGSCSPIVEEQMRPWEETRVAMLAIADAAAAPATPEPTPTPAVIIVTGAGSAEDAPTATIGVPVLRVRAEPSTNSEQIGVVYADQVYPIIGRSSDGLWMKLGEIPGLPAGSGWVISELALVIGDFSLIPVVQVPDGPAVPPSRNTEETGSSALVLPTPTPQPALIVTLEGPASGPASGATPIGESTNGSAGAGTDGADTDGADTDGADAATPDAAPPPAETPEATATVEATPEPATPEATVPVAAPPVAAVPPARGATLPAGVEAPPAGFALVVTDGVRLRVRDLPNMDSMIVGYAYSGEMFRVLDQSADGAWTQINGSATSKENPTGGWVATEFLYVSR